MIFLSHGFGGSRLGYKFLGQHWANSGFLAAHVGHDPSESRILAKATDRTAALVAALEEPERWANRAADVTAVIDALSHEEIPALRGIAAADRVAVAGHSFGAHTALCLAGAVLKVSTAPIEHTDPRPRCFVALSPPGLGGRGLHPGSLARIERSMLLIFGSRDLGPLGHGPEWRRQAFDDLAPGGKIELCIEGAQHETFAGAAAEGVAPDPAHLKAIAEATTAFLRAELFGEPGALRVLPAFGPLRRK